MYYTLMDGYVYRYGYGCEYGCDGGLYEMPDEIKDWFMIVDLVRTCETLLMQGQPSQTLDLIMCFLRVSLCIHSVDMSLTMALITLAKSYLCVRPL